METTRNVAELTERAKAKERAFVRNRFFIFTLGMFFNYSAYVTVMNLQSSFNIEEGLGMISLATAYFSSVVFILLCGPVILIRKFGPKKCLVACDVTYLIFLVANLYPEFYTMIPAAVIVGIGEGTIWTCMPMITAHFANEYTRLRKHEKKDYETIFNLFSGYFFTVFQSTQVSGNLVAYGVLYALNEPPSSSVDDAANSTTTVASQTTFSEVDEFYYCGANDCQDVEVVEENLNQYVPASKLSVDIMIGLFIAMCVAAVLIHTFLTPDIGSYVDSRRRGSEKVLLDGDSDIATSYNNFGIKDDINESKVVSISYNCIGFEDEDGDISLTERDCKSSVNSSTTTSLSDLQEQSNLNIAGLILNTLKDVGKHMTLPKQLLLIPITFYGGLVAGFVTSELTRAYSSCVLGVASVGITMAVFGLVNVAAAYLVGKYGQRVGRTTLFVVALSVDSLNYFYCLFWQPSLESAWSIYIVFGTFGFTDGLFQISLNIMYMAYFADNQDIALSVWNLFNVVGLSTQFALGTLCVSVKIIFQLSMLILGLLGYGFASRIHVKDQRNESRSETVLEATYL